MCFYLFSVSVKPAIDIIANSYLTFALIHTFHVPCGT